MQTAMNSCTAQPKAPPLQVLELAGSVALYGAERWILALVKNLNRERVQPVIAALRDDDSSVAPLCDAADHLRIPSIVIESPGRFDLASIWQLRRAIIRRRIDIVHTHGYKVDLLGRLATWGTRARILTTPHGWTFEPDIKLRIYEGFDRALYPFMDAVAPLSEAMYQGLAGMPWTRRKMHLIPNAVDLDELTADIEVAAELKEWKSRGFFIVGFIGRLIGAKGVLTLMRAVKQMRDQTVHLALVGTGPEEQSLLENARSMNILNRVRFFGYREDRLSFIKAFDVLALPSLSEGIPRCAMEAMGLGVPVVASDIPGCRALIESGNNGILVPASDPKALKDALELFRDDPAIRADMSNAAKKRVFAEFSAKRMAERYEELFFKVARSPN
jgi:glycosyltransferase involved in cell wall biosynthesis